jgi:plasmid stabilization system protein ParE
MRSYDLTDRALRDLTRARDWYDRGSIDLGNRFIDAVLSAVRTARERPTSCALVRNGVRGIRCKRFPYRVYFETHDDRIVVLAVYHTARNPTRWDEPDRD